MKKLLFIVAAIGLVVVAGTIMVGILTFEGTVVQNPYESGLRWDAEHRAREKAGWSVRVTPGAIQQGRSSIQVMITDSKGNSVNGAIVQVLLSRPETSRFDIEVLMEHGVSGGYQTIIAPALPGKWLAHIVVRKEGVEVTFQETFLLL